jgi:N-sulfoglucosamine sulfohydrolase
MVREKAWHAIVRAGTEGKLSDLHHRLLLRVPRPTHELFDLQADPYELKNLAGDPAMKEIETRLRNELARWMVREGDFLPIPSLNYPKDELGAPRP